LQAKLHIHIITRKKQINLYRKFNLYETQNTKKQPKPKIVRTADYNCAYVLIMAILKIAVAICEKFGDVKSTPVIYSSKSTSKP